MKGYKNIFSGFILVLLDINISTLDILPDFIGYILIINGLSNLYMKTNIKAFLTAKNISIVSLLMEFFNVFVRLEMIQVNYLMAYLMMNFMVFIQLMLVLYIYMGMASHMADLEKEKLTSKYESECKIFAVIQGLILLLTTFSLNMPIEENTLYTILLVAVSFIMHIRFLMNLSYAKKVEI